MWCNFKDVLQGRNKLAAPGDAPRQDVRLDEVWGAVAHNGGEGSRIINQGLSVAGLQGASLLELTCLSSLT